MKRPSLASILIASTAVAAFLLVPKLWTDGSEMRAHERLAAVAPDHGTRSVSEVTLVAPRSRETPRVEPTLPGSAVEDAPWTQVPAGDGPADPAPSPAGALAPEDPGGELRRIVLDNQAPYDERVRAMKTLRLLEAGSGTTLRSDEVVESCLWLVENAPLPDDRNDAVAALGGIRQPWAIERLGNLLLSDNDPQVRQKIARLLAGTPTVSAARYLERALESEPDALTRATLQELVSGSPSETR